VQDTVKVDLSQMPSVADAWRRAPAEERDKENQRRGNDNLLEGPEPDTQKEDAAKELLRQEELAKAAKAAAAEVEKRRLHEEQQKQQLIEIERRQAEIKVKEERVAAEQLRRKEEQERNFKQQEETARLLREKQELEAAQLAEKANSDKVAAFLKEHAFTGVNAKKTKMFRSKYPLHAAVETCDADMVRLLVSSGADPALKNSSGKTPIQLAQSSNKKDSHTRVLQALGVGSPVHPPIA
jgi:hypothetical protein